MNVNEFKERLKSANPGGWYIFAGEEEYLKRHYLSMLRDAVITDEASAPFNHMVFDGPELDTEALAEALKAPPMMSEFKLIEWRYADLEHSRESILSSLDELCKIKEYYPESVLALLLTESGFEVGTDKRPGKLFTRYSKAFDILNFPKSTESQLLSWLKKHFDAERLSVSRAALDTMLLRCGRAMDVLRGEVAKLSAYAKANGKAEITAEDVSFVTSSSPESDAFALSNSILARNREAAFLALEDMKLRKIEPIAALGMISKIYSELAATALLLDEGLPAKDIASALGMVEFKAKLYIGAAKKHGKERLISALSEISRRDAAMKSGGSAGYSVIETFIARAI